MSHKSKQAVVKAALTNRLVKRTNAAIAKYGLVTQARIEEMRAEEAAKLQRREDRRAARAFRVR